MSDDSAIECMLLRWGEGPSGRTVTLLLPEDTPHHPFKGLRTGPSNGQRLAIAVALIADNETTTPIKPAPQASEKPADGQNGEGHEMPKGGRFARQAGILCGDARFQRFLSERFGLHVSNAEDAADFIRADCAVKSRAEFDTDPDAARRWNRLYAEYQAEML